MSRIDELIQEHCPEGVEYKPLSDVTVRGANIKWSNTGDQEFQYIDLASVDRVTRKIGDTATITSGDAPSRAQQIIREGDVIFATTRPTQMRWAVIPGKYDGQIASTGYCVLRPVKDEMLTNFLAHLLGAARFRKYVEEKQVPGNYPSIPDSLVRAFRIPIPPIEIQQEIVRILDEFTQLEAELEAELEARRRQYEYYEQNIFLNLVGNDIRRIPLRDVGKWYGGGTPSKARADYWSEGTIPWISPKDMGSSLIETTEDYITEEAVVQSATKLVPQNAVALVVRSSILDHTLPIAFVPIPASLNQDMKAVVAGPGIIPRYLFHAIRASRRVLLQSAKRTGGSVASLDSQKLWEHDILVPGIIEQKRVVVLLDKFDTLVNDLSIGLPAELAARRKQYEYYRDRLLTFREATV